MVWLELSFGYDTSFCSSNSIKKRYPVDLLTNKNYFESLALAWKYLIIESANSSWVIFFRYDNDFYPGNCLVFWLMLTIVLSGCSVCFISSFKYSLALKSFCESWSLSDSLLFRKCVREQDESFEASSFLWWMVVKIFVKVTVALIRFLVYVTAKCIIGDTWLTPTKKQNSSTNMRHWHIWIIQLTAYIVCSAATTLRHFPNHRIRF